MHFTNTLTSESEVRISPLVASTHEPVRWLRRMRGSRFGDDDHNERVCALHAVAIQANFVNLDFGEIINGRAIIHLQFAFLD